MTVHVFYELAAGVGMPLASWTGPRRAASLWATGSALAFRAAGRQPAKRDGAFALLNGFYLAAVLAHFAGWPSTRRAGMPWLTECEGLTGRAVQPYNAILYASGVTALTGLLTENRRGRRRGALAAVALVPLAMWGQHHEFARLQGQARQQPAWWNRRLAQQPPRRAI
jgi:hypothetical protein